MFTSDLVENLACLNGVRDSERPREGLSKLVLFGMVGIITK